MPLFRRVLRRLQEETLLAIMLAVFIPLFWLAPVSADGLAALVDWKTIGALTGLMVLSRGLEASGFLAYTGRRMLAEIRNERTLAVVLVLFSAALSALITNDVALFIVVPITLSLGLVAYLPIGRLVIFEALAVNAGSAVSPIGNPQNLFLWQISGASFTEFLMSMIPLSLCLMLLLLIAVPLGFSKKEIVLKQIDTGPEINRKLLIISLLLYPVFLILTDQGLAMYAAAGVTLLFLFISREVLLGVDWLLLLVFIMMFVDLGLLATLPSVAAQANYIDVLPGGIFSAGVILSQVMSNVPAAIFLEAFTDDWQLLAWGASVGGFGLGIGSLANLIAMRLARGQARWTEFHMWSVPLLITGSAVALGLIFWLI
jgi:Na+/H+ antiporter NhaD/arsenite permease-like protein